METPVPPVDQLVVFSPDRELADDVRAALAGRIAVRHVPSIAPVVDDAWHDLATRFALVDLSFPGAGQVEGGTLLCRLREADPDESRAILALVQRGTRDARDAINAAADDLLMAPLDTDELANRLALCHRRAARISGELAARYYHAAALTRMFDALPVALLQFQVNDRGQYRVRYEADDFLRLGLTVPPVGADVDMRRMLRELVSPMDRERVVESLTRALRTHQSWTDAFTVRDALGVSRAVRGVTRPEPPDAAGVVTWNALLIDETEHRELETGIARAEATLRAREEFFAVMSHELRTPLNAVVGLNEAMEEEVYGPVTPRQREALSLMRRSGEHLLALITDVLDLSRIGAGAMQLARQRVPVARLCDAALRMTEGAAAQRGLRLEYHFDPSAEALPGDERRLTQVLVNLLDNAVKFTPEDGCVRLEVRGDAEHEVLRVTVADSGIGIDPRQLPRLFEPFVQLDAGLDRRFEGAGLGLALVARLVEMHGGSVSAASNGVQGEGTSFTVELPWPDRPEYRAVVPEDSGEIGLAHSASSASTSSAAVAARLADYRAPGRLRVLVADDNEANLRLLSDALQATGCDVSVARDGIEAVELTREYRPDLILMDIQMPKLDGLEATRRLRREAAFVSVPIIAVTALATPGHREACLAAGCTDYLRKPLSLRRLPELLARWSVASAPAADHA